MTQSILKRVLFFSIVMLIGQSISAQLRLQLKIQKYDILVKLTDDKYAPAHKIEINELGETSIWATPVPFSHNYFQVRKKEKQYHIQDIDYLSIRDNKQMRKRALIGGLIGLGVGIIISRTHGGEGHNADDHFLWSPELEHAAYIIAGTTVGVAIGALTGMLRVKIPINGKKSLYNKNRKQLEKYIQY